MLAIGLKLLLGWTGWCTAFFTAPLLFIIGLTAWSFSVEGRRRAKDRFASTLIYASLRRRHRAAGADPGLHRGQGVPACSASDFFLNR